jgi:acetylglutamate kinase
MAQSMGLNPEMIDGRRITDAPMLDVAVMIYAGQKIKKYWLNYKPIILMRWIFRCRWNLIQSEKNHPTIDYGLWAIKSVNARCYKLCSNGITLFFCAITH